MGVAAASDDVACEGCGDRGANCGCRASTASLKTLKVSAGGK